MATAAKIMELVESRRQSDAKALADLNNLMTVLAKFDGKKITSVGKKIETATGGRLDYLCTMTHLHVGQTMWLLSYDGILHIADLPKRNPWADAGVKEREPKFAQCTPEWAAELAMAQAALEAAQQRVANLVAICPAHLGEILSK